MYCSISYRAHYTYCLPLADWNESVTHRVWAVPVPSGIWIAPLWCHSWWWVTPGAAAPPICSRWRERTWPSRLPLSHLHSLSSHSLALSHLLSQDLEPLALSDRKCSSDRESRNSMGSRNKGKGSISLGTVSECLFCLHRPFELFISHKAFVARHFFFSLKRIF